MPIPNESFSRHEQPSFSDHYLFTEWVDDIYDYPEHTSGLGILSMLAGSAVCQVNSEKYTINPASFLPLNRGSRLSIHLFQKHVHPCFLFFHSKLPGLIMSSLEFSHEKLLDNLGVPFSFDFSLLERLHSRPANFFIKFDCLIHLSGSCSSLVALKADGIVRSILEELILENHSAHRLSGRLAVAKQSTRRELFKRLSRAREWIEDNFSSHLTLVEMAGIANLNSQHFLRMFRQCYGVTPCRFLVEIRLQHAKKMLLESDQNISMICSEIGLESLSSFSWLFRQRFGKSPLLFRKHYSAAKSESDFKLSSGIEV